MAAACQGPGPPRWRARRGHAGCRVSWAAELGGHVVGHCDVTEGASIDAVFAEVGRLWGGLDFLVHAIAFSDKSELTGRYLDTTEANFTRTMLISCYSLLAIGQRAEKLLSD